MLKKYINWMFDLGDNTVNLNSVSTGLFMAQLFTIPMFALLVKSEFHDINLFLLILISIILSVILFYIMRLIVICTTRVKK